MLLITINLLISTKYFLQIYESGGYLVEEIGWLLVLIIAMFFIHNLVGILIKTVIGSLVGCFIGYDGDAMY